MREAVVRGCVSEDEFSLSTEPLDVEHRDLTPAPRWPAVCHASTFIAARASRCAWGGVEVGSGTGAAPGSPSAGGSARVEPCRLVAMALGWSGTSTRTKSAPSKTAMERRDTRCALAGWACTMTLAAYPSVSPAVIESTGCRVHSDSTVARFRCFSTKNFGVSSMTSGAFGRSLEIGDAERVRTHRCQRSRRNARPSAAREPMSDWALRLVHEGHSAWSWSAPVGGSDSIRAPNWPTTTSRC